MLKTIVTAMALGISVIVTESTEAEILVTCVYDDNSPCLAKPPQTTLPNNSTWYIPAIGENEPGSETSMEIRFPDFTYSQVSINGGSFIDRPGPDNGGFFEVLDPDGSRSDVVLIYPPDIAFDNRIVIRSDPDIGSPLQFPNLGTLDTEGDTGATGATMTLRGFNGELRFTFGFDAEFVYDPFGVGVDTSDDVQVFGSPPDAFLFAVAAEGPPVINQRVPEPSSLFLLCSGLTGVAALAMRQHRRKAPHRK